MTSNPFSILSKIAVLVCMIFSINANAQYVSFVENNQTTTINISEYQYGISINSRTATKIFSGDAGTNSIIPIPIDTFLARSNGEWLLFTSAIRQGAFNAGDLVIFNRNYISKVYASGSNAQLLLGNGNKFTTSSNYATAKTAVTQKNTAGGGILAVVPDNATIEGDGVGAPIKVKQNAINGGNLTTTLKDTILQQKEIVFATYYAPKTQLDSIKVGGKVYGTTSNMVATKKTATSVMVESIDTSGFPTTSSTSYGGVTYDYSKSRLRNNNLDWHYDTKDAKWVLDEGQTIAKASFPTLGTGTTLIKSIRAAEDSAFYVVKTAIGGTPKYFRQTPIYSATAPLAVDGNIDNTEAILIKPINVGTEKEVYNSTKGKWLPVNDVVFNTISEMTAYTGNAEQVQVTDSLRGGIFKLRTLAGNAIDNGKIFSSNIAGYVWVRQYKELVYAEWYGAKSGDTLTDNTSIQNLFSNIADGETAVLEKGEFLIENTLNVTKNIKIRGKATLKIKNNTRIRAIVKSDGDYEIDIQNITFDMNMQNMPVYQNSEYLTNTYNVGIYIVNSNSNININECTFKNLYSYSIQLYTLGGNSIINIDRNNFTSPVQPQNLRAEHLNFITVNVNLISIQKNRFDNAPSTSDYGVSAMILAGVHSKTTIKENYFNYCGRNNAGTHRVLAIDLYSDCEYITITNNTFDNNLWGFVRLEDSKELTVKNNIFKLAANVELTEPSIWVVDSHRSTAEENVEIQENQFYFQSTNIVPSCIAVFATDWGALIKNVSILNNSVYGKCAIFVQAMPCIDNLNVSENKSFQYQGNKPRFIFNLTRELNSTTSLTGLEINSFLRNVTIFDNKWNSESSAVYAELLNYTGSISALVIRNNYFSGAYGQGSNINVRNCPSIIQYNTLRTAPEAVQIVGSKLAIIDGNIIDDMEYPDVIYTISATNVVEKNNYVNGILIGNYNSITNPTVNIVQNANGEVGTAPYDNIISATPQGSLTVATAGTSQTLVITNGVAPNTATDITRIEVYYQAGGTGAKLRLIPSIDFTLGTISGNNIPITLGSAAAIGDKFYVLIK